MTANTLRTCPKGHQFYKTSDCPNCPICENDNKPSKGFLSLISAPARRALASKEIHTLSKLAQFKSAEVAALHGMGPTAMAKLENALKEKGLSFKREDDKNKIE